MIKRLPRTPFLVFPPVYEIPMNFWRWCRFEDVRDYAVMMWFVLGLDLSPSKAEFLTSFASLVRPNSFPPSEDRKKIFRFTLDGLSLRGVEVPLSFEDGPPRKPFSLGLSEQELGEALVPEGWARDVLKAVRLGGVKAIDYGPKHTTESHGSFAVIGGVGYPSMCYLDNPKLRSGVNTGETAP